RNPSKAMLEKAGIQTDQIASVDYSGRKTPEVDQSLITEAQLKRLWSIAKSKNLSDETLKEILKDRGYTSSREIKKKDYDAIVNLVQNYKPEAKPETKEGPAATAPSEPSEKG